MRKYVSALKARGAEIRRGTMLKILLVSIVLVVAAFVIVGFVGERAAG